MTDEQFNEIKEHVTNQLRFTTNIILATLISLMFIVGLTLAIGIDKILNALP
jgi:hypothetical protein